MKEGYLRWIGKVIGEIIRNNFVFVLKSFLFCFGLSLGLPYVLYVLTGVKEVLLLIIPLSFVSILLWFSYDCFYKSEKLCNDR